MHTKSRPSRIFMVTTVAALLLMISSRAKSENAPPDGGPGFGCFYDETFGNTVVYARCGWLTFSYVYSGFEPMMPAPGWIQVALSMRGDYFGADEVEVQLDGHPAFQFADYPYFGLTPSQLESMVNAKTVDIEARWWTLGRRVQNDKVKAVNRRERLRLSSTDVIFLKELAQFGKNSAAPKTPWMIAGAIGYVIDGSDRMAPKLKEVKQMLIDSIAARTDPIQNYCFVIGNGNQVRQAPAAPHHIVRFKGGIPEQSAAARAFLGSLKTEKRSEALEVKDDLIAAANQQVQTIVLFTAGDVKFDNFDETVRSMHQFTARVYVIWCGGAKADLTGREKLKRLCELTGGGLIALK